MPNLLDIYGFFKQKENITYFNFGRWEGERATDHRDYLEWMQLQDFPEDTLEVVEALLAGEHT